MSGVRTNGGLRLLGDVDCSGHVPVGLDHPGALHFALTSRTDGHRRDPTGIDDILAITTSAEVIRTSTSKKTGIASARQEPPRRVEIPTRRPKQVAADAIGTNIENMSAEVQTHGFTPARLCRLEQIDQNGRNNDHDVTLLADRAKSFDRQPRRHVSPVAAHPQVLPISPCVELSARHPASVDRGVAFWQGGGTGVSVILPTRRVVGAPSR